MNTGKIVFRNAHRNKVTTTCVLDSDGKWSTKPADKFLTDWLNRDFSPSQFGPADGDRMIAAVEAAHKEFGGDVELPDPLPEMTPGAIY